jgi:hypothetical protein
MASDWTQEIFVPKSEIMILFEMEKQEDLKYLISQQGLPVCRLKNKFRVFTSSLGA